MLRNSQPNFEETLVATHKAFSEVSLGWRAGEHSCIQLVTAAYMASASAIRHCRRRPEGTTLRSALRLAIIDPATANISLIADSSRTLTDI